MDRASAGRRGTAPRGGGAIMTVIALAIAVVFASWWGTRSVRAYALSRRLLDVPNQRSSHTVVTPRGGGVAIAAATLAGVGLLSAFGRLPPRGAIALMSAGLLVALVGFADDRRHVPVLWRLLGHVAAAILVLVALGGAPPLPLFGPVRDLGAIGALLVLLSVVWMINLTNFMDGIDGIAAVETITVCTGGFVLGAMTQATDGHHLVALVLGCAALGFLAWNWPPASIFMGDAGSGFLGLMLAAVAFQAASASPALFWAWGILLGGFVVDATITLLRRAARGDRFVEAHRTHAYQHAAQRWGHTRVTLALAAVNLAWLLPIAALVVDGQLTGISGLLLAYAPLVAVAVALGAGQPASSRARVY
jgi:Fuc2NAc and GlcNAc transferase